MESNLEQSKDINSLAMIKAIVQRDNNKKEEILKERDIKVLSVVDQEDIKKMKTAYKEAVDRNSMVIDFIVDIKNDILKIKLVKDKLDRTLNIYLQQAKAIDEYIKILNDMLSIMRDEKDKLYRVVQYYEKVYSNYNY